MAGNDEREVTKESDESTPTELSESSESVDEAARSDADATQSEAKAAQSGEETMVDRQAAIDSAAESFIEVEEELSHLTKEMQVRGRAIDVEQVPASEVPDDYPIDVTTEDALALYVVLEGTNEQTVVTYFEWPQPGASERLGILLDLLDVPMDRFADLHGESILLEVEDGYYVPVLPEQRRRGSEKAIYGVFAGLSVNLALALTMIFGVDWLVASGGFALVWLFANLLLLPVATYLDAWNLRTTTNWQGGPLFWATLALIPGLNVMTVAAYIVIRKTAEPLA